MKLTPLDIRHKEFRKAMRGYSEEDVDVFLDEVADEFERLIQENIDLRERAQRLQEQVAQHDELKETLQKTLVGAQQQADDTRATARKEGDLILRDSELKGRDIISEAHAEKQRVQQSLIQLRQIEEDFRFKFRSLLEAHLNLLAEDEVSDERRQFRGLVAGVEEELHSVDTPSEPAKAEPEPTRPPAASAPAPSAPRPAVIDGGLQSGRSPVEEPAAVRSAVSEEPNMRGYAPRLPSSEPDRSPGEAVEGDDEKKASPVKRFFFGKRQKEGSDLFEGDDRDFQW